MGQISRCGMPFASRCSRSRLRCKLLREPAVVRLRNGGQRGALGRRRGARSVVTREVHRRPGEVPGPTDQPIRSPPGLWRDSSQACSDEETGRFHALRRPRFWTPRRGRGIKGNLPVCPARPLRAFSAARARGSRVYRGPLVVRKAQARSSGRQAPSAASRTASLGFAPA